MWTERSRVPGCPSGSIPGCSSRDTRQIRPLEAKTSSTCRIRLTFHRSIQSPPLRNGPHPALDQVSAACARLHRNRDPFCPIGVNPVRPGPTARAPALAMRVSTGDQGMPLQAECSDPGMSRRPAVDRTAGPSDWGCFREGRIRSSPLGPSAALDPMLRRSWSRAGHASDGRAPVSAGADGPWGRSSHPEIALAIRGKILVSCRGSKRSRCRKHCSKPLA
jgi:hypothetical protein